MGRYQAHSTSQNIYSPLWDLARNQPAMMGIKFCQQLTVADPGFDLGGVDFVNGRCVCVCGGG